MEQRGRDADRTRPGGGRLAHWEARIVNGAIRLVSGVTAGYQRRDRVLARQAAAILLGQLAAWLGTVFIGYCLLMLALVHGGIGMALTTAGSSMFTLGFAGPTGLRPLVAVFAAAFTSLAGVAVDPGWPASLVHQRGPVPAAERHPGADRIQLSGARPGPAADDLECVSCAGCSGQPFVVSGAYPLK
jgi:hypothetical protein